MSEQKKKVENLNEALSVLIQGVEMGRKRGIYDWNDLEIISSAIGFVNTLAERIDDIQSENVNDVEVDDKQ